jgi:hypothetical protein
MAGKRRYPALWVALGFYGVFAAFGAVIGFFDVFLRQRQQSPWFLDVTLSLMREGLGIKHAGLGLTVLAGALGYGFIGFDLWLLIWIIYRCFKWGFLWKPGDPHPLTPKRDQGI